MPSGRFWRSFPSVWMLSEKSTTVCMARIMTLLRVMQQKRINNSSSVMLPCHNITHV